MSKLFLSALLLLTGCVTGVKIAYHPEAENIPILRMVPAVPVERLGQASCVLGRNMRPQSENIRLCQTHLRGQAFEMGGRALVVELESIGSECANCVTIHAGVYTLLK